MFARFIGKQAARRPIKVEVLPKDYPWHQPRKEDWYGRHQNQLLGVILLGTVLWFIDFAVGSWLFFLHEPGSFEEVVGSWMLGIAIWAILIIVALAILAVLGLAFYLGFRAITGKEL